MKSSSNVKEQIIQATTELIQQSNGNIADITTRAIAEKACVGVGLINYHFQTKDNLITICVQRIIEQVISSFYAKGKSYQGDKDRLTDWATRVFDFLFANPAISRISIIGDLCDYTNDTNSAKTQKGFARALQEDVSDFDKNMLTFILTASMQTAFLGSKSTPELLGYDFSNQSDRQAFITRLISFLFDGIKAEQIT